MSKLEQQIIQKQKELTQVEYKLDHGGDFIVLFEKKKMLTDEIRALKLQLQSDQCEIQRNPSEQAIVNDDDDDESGDEECDGSIDLDNM